MTTINEQSDSITLASITTRLITAAMSQQRSDPRRDVAEHLDTLIDSVTVFAHGIERGQSVANLPGPTAAAAAQIHALALRRRAHLPAYPMQTHIAHYLTKLTAVAIDAADAADLTAATIADGIH